MAFVAHPLLPNLLLAFTALPLSGAGIALVTGRVHLLPRFHSQSLISLLVGLLNLLLAVFLLVYCARSEPLVLHVGGRTGPFGIMLVADVFSALMLALTAVIHLASVPYAIDLLDERDRMGFYPLSLFLLMGVNGTFLAGDLFNLYVFFEILVISSFVLVTLGGQADQIKGGLRFVVLNLLASMVFLGAIAITYGVLGTLNLAHIAMLLPQTIIPQWVMPVLAGLLFVAFGSKAALFPFHFWLPCSYHTTHPVINALFGGLLTKVGMYALFRMYPLLFPALLTQWQVLFVVLAAGSMIVGTLGALAGQTIRRALSFKIISHIGFIFVGLAVAGSPGVTLEWALAAAIVYLVHHMIVKTALLMAGGAVEHVLQAGRLPLQFTHHRGLLAHYRGLGVWFFLAAISLVGFPPFSGFVGKLGMMQLMVATGQWALLAVTVATSIVTLIVIFRLWQGFFWGRARSPRPSADSEPKARASLLSLSPIAGLVVCSLLVGIFGQQVWSISSQAATQLADRGSYIQNAGLADHLDVEAH